MSRPILLDLFSGAGGASVGYDRAGFDVLGIDLAEQPNYPLPFLRMDAIEALKWLLSNGTLQFDNGRCITLDDIAVIHASPPCQRFSPMTQRWGVDHAATWPNLIGPTRELLLATGRTYVIENVEAAKKELLEPIMLCGGMFVGLHSDYKGERFTLRRHRLFESNGLIWPPVDHVKHEGRALGVYGHPGGSSTRDGISFPQFDNWKEGMGVDWTTVHELAESIPPTYTQWIGHNLLKGMSL